MQAQAATPLSLPLPHFINNTSYNRSNPATMVTGGSGNNNNNPNIVGFGNGMGSNTIVGNGTGIGSLGNATTMRTASPSSAMGIGIVGTPQLRGTPTGGASPVPGSGSGSGYTSSGSSITASGMNPVGLGFAVGSGIGTGVITSVAGAGAGGMNTTEPDQAHASVSHLLSRGYSLPCSTAAQAFTQLVQPTARFQLALDALLPLLDSSRGVEVMFFFRLCLRAC